MEEHRRIAVELLEDVGRFPDAGDSVSASLKAQVAAGHALLAIHEQLTELAWAVAAEPPRDSGKVVVL